MGAMTYGRPDGTRISRKAEISGTFCKCRAACSHEILTHGLLDGVRASIERTGSGNSGGKSGGNGGGKRGGNGGGNGGEWGPTVHDVK